LDPRAALGEEARVGAALADGEPLGERDEAGDALVLGEAVAESPPPAPPLGVAVKVAAAAVGDAAAEGCTLPVARTDRDGDDDMLWVALALDGAEAEPPPAGDAVA